MRLSSAASNAVVGSSSSGGPGEGPEPSPRSIGAAKTSDCGGGGGGGCGDGASDAFNAMGSVDGGGGGGCGGCSAATLAGGRPAAAVGGEGATASSSAPSPAAVGGKVLGLLLAPDWRSTIHGWMHSQPRSRTNSIIAAERSRSTRWFTPTVACSLEVRTACSRHEARAAAAATARRRIEFAAAAARCAFDAEVAPEAALTLAIAT